MNRALLAELQRQLAYPSITILQPTRPGATMHPDDVAMLIHHADLADRRLEGDVTDLERRELVTMITNQIDAARHERATRAIAICVSPAYQCIVRLGREVRPRVIIDDTFATRDMVADVNRTATFRVITVSDRKARVLLGDRNRLVEDRSVPWPLLREDDQPLASWSRAVSHAVQAIQRDVPLPTVLAGVDRSVREILKLDNLQPIGVVSGNHDRTSWADLHHLAWPHVVDWLRTDADRAHRQLSLARDSNRFAGGIDEVWELANDGRVELLVVEEGYEFAARVNGGRLVPAADRWAPDVIDDAVDELIETVLRKGGEAVIVPEGDLAHVDRLGAVLRY
jgi:Bacterial archaeo-eukaryotic release factor family 3